MMLSSDPGRPVWGGWGNSGLEAPPLAADAECDVCIVGAGIAGLLIAERLLNEGLSVIVLDAGAIAGGETSRTTAHFVSALDDRWMWLERVHGHQRAAAIAQSHLAAIGYVEDLVKRLGLSCGWRRVDGFLTVNERHAADRDDLLAAELAAAHRMEVPAFLVDRLPGAWPREWGPALCFTGQAQVHPMQLLRGVVDAIRERGGRIHTRSHVKHVHGGPNASVETDNGPTVRCRHVVVATNTPINNLFAVHTKQSGFQTYVVALPIGSGWLPPILAWDGLWKDDTAYRYIRIVEGLSVGAPNDFLIVGGEDHKTGQGPEADAFTRLEQWTRGHFPACGEVAFRWSGEVMEPADGVAYIGHNAADRKNVYIVTGDSGNGMTHSAIAAMLIPDLILERENPWQSVYDPARKVGMHALGEYLSENLNTLRQYGDWFKPGDVTDEDQIPRGEGGIIRQGLRHLAVYKDEQGCCTRLNAMCTHLGGIVRWNSLEKTWDCPCHASRFDAQGRVIHGPANTDLKPAEPEVPDTVKELPAES